MSTRTTTCRILIAAAIAMATATANAQQSNLELDQQPGQPPSRLFETHLLPDTLVLEPLADQALMMDVDLIVNGPEGFYLRKSFPAGQLVEFNPADLADNAMPDGTYVYEVRIMGLATGTIQRGIEDGLALQRDTLLPNAGGAFSIQDGRIITPQTEPRNDQFAARVTSTSDSTQAKGSQTIQDMVVNDDKIIQGSLCVGFDCVNGESFGFDTIRLKENNTRIKFDDTSNSASFPNNDWQLTANDSANGGLNKFSIENTTVGRIPFTIVGSAPSNSLYVRDNGNVGLGTSTPSVEAHIVDGDTPTVRLEQDGSSGFSPQTWDVAGNETNFFVRDVTNGSRIPFKIRPGAANNSLVIDSEGQIAIGGANADEPLHIQQSTGSEANAIKLSNNNSSVIWFENTAAGQSWKVSNNTNAFRISLSGSGGPEFEVDNDGTVRMGPGTGAVFVLDPSGNLTISGSLTANGSTFPDYVFEDDYKLLDIQEVKAYIEDYGRLPNLPSANEIERDGLNMTEMQKKMMEKIEELTLYTIQQQERIEKLEADLASLR